MRVLEQVDAVVARVVAGRPVGVVRRHDHVDVAQVEGAEDRGRLGLLDPERDPGSLDGEPGEGGRDQ